MSRGFELGRHISSGGSSVANEGLASPDGRRPKPSVRAARPFSGRFDHAPRTGSAGRGPCRGQIAGDRGRTGQALAEFALVAVPLLLLLLGIVQFALIYNAQVGLTNAIRDAARYGSGLAVTTTAGASSAATQTYARLTTALAANVSPFSAARLVSGSRACFGQHDDGTGAQAAFVRVTATYDHELVVPLIGAILDAIDGTSNNAFRISATTEIRVDNPTEAAISISPDQCSP